MTFAERRSAFFALLFLLLASPLSAQQQNSWDAPPFAADPKAVLAAAERASAGEYARVMLLDEVEYVLEADGRMRSTERWITRVVAEAAVANSSTLSAWWSPWYEERPQIDARVIAKDGTAYRLDPAAIVDNAAPESDTSIFSDTRVVRAPLPAVAVGSVVESVITRIGRNPLPGTGTSERFRIGAYIPIEHTRVVIDAPAGLTPRIVNKTAIEPRIEEKDGRRRTIYETGRIEAAENVDRYVPYDVDPFGYIAFSTGSSWSDIATQYSAIVDKQIAGSDLRKQVRAAIGKATDRKEIVARLLAAIQKDIRYAGVEVGEGSIVPRKPQQVLANQYGDCKDKATLLVAMLREAGLSAHVALLRAGSDFDVLPDLPGLGRFNHAIVIVEGEPPIWVDPTDIYARAGELPILDQGRLALIAGESTTTLTRTPESEPAANVYRERRTYHLPEEGKARIVEVTEISGVAEAPFRRWVSSSNAKALRENLESYVQSTYVVDKLAEYEHTDPRDVATPFRLTLEAEESSTGRTIGGESAVGINVPNLFRWTPEVLRDWKEPQPNDDPKKNVPRKHDFLFPQAEVREWVYRILPPPGYAPRTLPPSETKQLGTTTLTQQFRATDDGAIEATFRFETGKRRLTPAEFTETRVAISKFIANDPVVLGFEHVGQTKLAAGDVRGALEEFRRLATLHPKEAQHHIELARALLAGGLGNAAREELRRAITIEPDNARAHFALGDTLLHDLLGRKFRNGFDLAGAIAELRKAKELDPKDLQIRVALAGALTYGEDGIRFGKNARLAEAATEYEALKELGDEGKAYQPELILVYAHAGRFADVRELSKTLEDQHQRNMAKVFAAVALDGIDAGVRELNAYDQQQRRQYAGGIAEVFGQLRMYPQALALTEVATQGSPAAGEQASYIEMLRKVKRYEDLPADDGPKGAVIEFFRAAVFGDYAAFEKIIADEQLRKELAKNPLGLAPDATDEVTPAGTLDTMLALTQFKQDGDDESGYRVRVEGMTFYLLREDGRWKIGTLSSGNVFPSDTVLRLAQAGKTDVARRWLSRIREDVKGGSTDDPLEGNPLTAVWSKSKSDATPDEVLLAAAMIGADEKRESILVAGREKVTNEQARAAIDLELTRLYWQQEQWPKALGAAERVTNVLPDSTTAFVTHIQALLENKKYAEAAKLANERLERMPNDSRAIRALVDTAASQGDYAAAQRYATRLVDETQPTPNDYNSAAWMALFSGAQLERAIELAHQAANAEGSGVKGSSLHTLAALYAESGKSLEAREALLQRLEAESRSALDGADWYVIGRLAENYGVRDVAIDAYKRVDVDKTERNGATVHELAQKRLAALVKTK